MSPATLTYRSAARDLLSQGVEELRAGDPRQASEKGWGAAAQIIKAVASDRRWKHHSHAALFGIVDRLEEETGDSSLQLLFASANALHQNFYENFGSARFVAEGLRNVADLFDKLEPLLER